MGTCNPNYSLLRGLSGTVLTGVTSTLNLQVLVKPHFGEKGWDLGLRVWGS